MRPPCTSAALLPANHRYIIVMSVNSLIYYCPQSSCGKVMFSQACVKNSVEGEGGLSQHILGHTPPCPVHAGIHPPPGQTPHRQTPPPGQIPPPPGRHRLPRRPHQRSVCILLECIFVQHSFTEKKLYKKWPQK